MNVCDNLDYKRKLHFQCVFSMFLFKLSFGMFCASITQHLKQITSCGIWILVSNLKHNPCLCNDIYFVINQVCCIFNWNPSQFSLNFCLGACVLIGFECRLGLNCDKKHASTGGSNPFQASSWLGFEFFQCEFFVVHGINLNFANVFIEGLILSMTSSRSIVQFF